MPKINLNNKTFILLENSKNGEVNSETRFHYKQEGTLVTADYSGGTVIKGSLIGQFLASELVVLYHCITTSNELKAGKATAQVFSNSEGRIELHLQWEWLTSGGAGKSVYIEHGSNS